MEEKGSHGNGKGWSADSEWEDQRYRRVSGQSDKMKKSKRRVANGKDGRSNVDSKP
jgi:hypothetical protein